MRKVLQKVGKSFIFEALQSNQRFTLQQAYVHMPPAGTKLGKAR
jgi:hypothetical protein